jgi:hypothetical protein
LKAACPLESSGHCWIGANEAQQLQIEFFNGGIDRANWIVLTHAIVQTLGQQCGLVSVFTLDESFHPAPARERVAEL